jgi:hypothetical protein
MTTLPTQPNDPVELSYAAKERPMGMRVMGITSIVLGVVFTCATIYLSKNFWMGMAFELFVAKDFVSASGLMLLGLVSMLLGNVTLVRAGIMAVNNHPKAGLAHRVYARFLTYGVMAVILGLLWEAGLLAQAMDLPFWGMWLFLFASPFGKWCLIFLVYPAVVMRLPMFKKIKPARQG